MTEDLLHFIWKLRLLRPIPLCTTGNFPLEIVHPGMHNTHAGPDFSNGRIRLKDVEWAGNIELHWRSSEWNQHGHHLDAAYNNVILHVVYEHDKAVFTSENRCIPTLELQHYIEPGLLEKYGSLYRNKQEIPCGTAFSQCNEIHRESWLGRVLVERLEEKTAFIHEIYEGTKHDWDETFYRLLCRSFGFKVNAEPFLHLAGITPLRLLLKHAGNLLQVESLLFGQAGLLQSEFDHPYPIALQKEYRFLQHKYSLKPMLPQSWKFMRMRPANFPSVRIAQMATFLQNFQHAFSKIIGANSLEEILPLFNISASCFWNDHYTFTRTSPAGVKKLGLSSIENVFINTVCPLLFFYGKQKQDETLCEKAVDWYASLGAEDNHITRLFKELGFKSAHAGHSQALIQLHKNYCSAKKCLHCAIGAQALRSQPLIEV